MPKLFVILLAVLSFVAERHQADATVIAVNSQGAFNAQATGLTTVNFEDLVIPNNQPSGGYTTAASITEGNVQFASGAPAFTIYEVKGQGFGPNSSGSQYIQADGGGNFTVSLTGTYTAVGSYLFQEVNPATATITVTDTAGTTVFTPTVPLGTGSTTGLYFLGFIDTNPILSLTFAAGPGLPSLDDFAFGTAVVVPEPASLTLLALAAVGLVFYGRRLRRS